MSDRLKIWATISAITITALIALIGLRAIAIASDAPEIQSGIVIPTSTQSGNTTVHRDPAPAQSGSQASDSSQASTARQTSPSTPSSSSSSTSGQQNSSGTTVTPVTPADPDDWDDVDGQDDDNDDDDGDND